MPDAGPRKDGVNNWAWDTSVSIDESTEKFRRQLAANACETMTSKRRHVMGGLPPHLLRQRDQTASVAAASQTDRAPTDVPQTKMDNGFGHALMSSRWSATQEQPQKAGDIGGVRLSVNTNGSCLTLHYSTEQQQPQREQPKQEKVRRQKRRSFGTLDEFDFCTSSLNFDDNESSTRIFDGGDDVRGTVAGDLDLVPRMHGEGFYNKNKWNEYPEDPEDPHNCKWRPSYSQLWVKEMEAQLPWPCAKFLEIPDLDHKKCDVQPLNGWLMAPVDYPDTHINPDEINKTKCSRVESRRLQGTVNLKMRADHDRLKRRVDQRGSEVLWDTDQESGISQRAIPLQTIGLQQQAHRVRPETLQGSSSRPVSRSDQMYQSAPPLRAQPTPPPTQMTRQPIVIPGMTYWHPIHGHISHAPKVIEPEDPSTFLKTPCFLRPVEEGDLPQMLDIYNREVTQGMQALDTKVLHLEDMRRVLKRCEFCKTPMIVAVAGRSAESVARKKASQDPRPSRSQSTSPQRRELVQIAGGNDKVLGFAFISIESSGLSGDIYYNVDRIQGQVRLYVDHNSRRKGVGRALLQQITLFCSRLIIVSNDDFEWYDSEKDTRYEDACHNVRSYSRLFLKFASRAKDDPDTEWMSKFLDSENYICIATKDKCRKVGHGQDGAVVDVLEFQHDCQKDPRSMRENK